VLKACELANVFLSPWCIDPAKKDTRICATRGTSAGSYRKQKHTLVSLPCGSCTFTTKHSRLFSHIAEAMKPCPLSPSISLAASTRCCAFISQHTFISLEYTPPQAKTPPRSPIDKSFRRGGQCVCCCCWVLVNVRLRNSYISCQKKTRGPSDPRA